MESYDYEKEAQHVEQEAKFKIISMKDDEDDKKRIIDDAKEECTRLYNEFREWLSNNINSKETSERLQRLKQETTNLVNRTKMTLHEFQSREEVIAGKEKAKVLGSKVVDSVNDGFHDVVHNEHVSKVVDTLSDTIDTVVNDERIVQGVKKLKKETLKVAENAFNGLKRLLESDDDQSSDQKG